VTRRIQLVRLIGSCLVLLAAVFFSHEFSTMQLDAFVYGAGYPIDDLPSVCIWFARYSTWALLLPPVFAWAGIRRLVRDRHPSTAVELLSQVTLLLALGLVLGCILAWQLPYVIFEGESF
jgi:hypothetical protein